MDTYYNNNNNNNFGNDYLSTVFKKLYLLL